MVNIVAICAGIILLAVLAVFIYYLIYTNRINKKIRSGEISGKRLIDIPKIIMIAVIIVLILFCGILSNSLQTAYNNAGKTTRNNYATIDISDPQNYQYTSYFGDAELDDASFAKMYSIEENIGYTKEVTVDGNFTFTVFKRESAADSFHPDFLCYCEYTGEVSQDLTLYNSPSFSNENGSISSGIGCEVSDALLYIGNMDEQTVFTISISVLDEKAISEFNDAMNKAMTEDSNELPEEKDFAISSGKVSIDF
ncbi:MAG: hypothetical protein LUH14_06675 [Clostridiaceae bacterium]|nr:hypothetical protein [Clostridiaceae bacterium]